MKHLNARIATCRAINSTLIIIAISCICGIGLNKVNAQNAGISFNGSAPNASAAFDISVAGLAGQKKGLLVPRVTQVEREAMNPLPQVAPGLLVYQSFGTAPGFYYNTSSTLVPDWKLLASENTVRWDGLQNPTTNNQIDHGAFATTFTFNGVTDYNAFRLSSNSLTKSNLLSLGVTSTDGASGFTTTGLSISKSGANENAFHTSQGISSIVYNTGLSSTNIAGYFNSYGGTNSYALVVPQGGGRVTLGSETSSTNSILSINNGHLQSKQTTRPTIVTSIGAGTLSDGTVDEFSSDVAGTFTINTNVGTSNGEQATITFNKTFSKAPVVVVTAASLNGASRSFYVASTQSSFKIYFTIAPLQQTSYTYNYVVIEN
ncbi:MAG: hypothetical protein V4722_16610 [Bacteroidota bacterium]